MTERESQFNCLAKILQRGLVIGAQLLLLLLLSSSILAQSNKQPDIWEPLKYFIGSWEGTAKGQPGNGKVEREYQFVLNGKYLSAKNKSTYSPQEKNPKGEVHEDWGLISYDRDRKLFVLRQFHIEGFVNQYTLDMATSNSKTLVFVTESIENITTGWRARESYRILNNDEFIEVFELAAPGKEFEIYAENHFKRRK
ncbi:MAG: hypothetical protein MOB07_04565 [Acidobacteria bacterium]|nr:hypothetical protein [Acidobacteriota bacterium]